MGTLTILNPEIRIFSGNPRNTVFEKKDGCKEWFVQVDQVIFGSVPQPQRDPKLEALSWLKNRRSPKSKVDHRLVDHWLAGLLYLVAATPLQKKTVCEFIGKLLDFPKS